MHWSKVGSIVIYETISWANKCKNQIKLGTKSKL